MNIATIAEENNIVYDRYLGKTLVLPYSGFDAIRIQPNDTATHAVINLALNKLYTNFLYLYKSCRLASNVIPISSTGIAGVSAGSHRFAWTTFANNLSSSQFIPLSTARLWNQDFITNIVVGYNNSNTQFSMFTTAGDDLVVYNADTRFFLNDYDKDTSISLAYSAKDIDINTGFTSNVYWQKIDDMVLGDNNTLFVLDLGAYTIRKYDTSGFFTGDEVLYNKLIYKDSIGGYGGFDDQSLFNDPRNIDAFNGYLYVLDSGNGCVKQYDQDLNWVTTYRLFRDFVDAYPVHLSHDVNGNMYILTNQNTIYRYDNNFQNKTSIPIHSLSATLEVDKKLVFSASDPNIFYLVTDKNIYKRLVSEPDQDVGNYLFYLNNFDTTEIISDFYSLSGQNNDYNFMVSRNAATNAAKITIWYDNINLYNVLSVSDFDVYSFDEIAVEPEEYLQNWVFNKSLAKLLISHQRLANHIIGQFQAKRDPLDNVTFRGTRYFLPTELYKVEFSQDLSYFIGMNEIFQNNIVNRCLKKIYDIQVNMLNALQAEIQTNYPMDGIVFIN